MAQKRWEASRRCGKCCGDNLYRRRNGANALAAIGAGARDAIPELIQALKEDDSWVNYHAATALGKCGPEAREAIPALRELLRSDRAKVSYLGSRKEEDALRHPNDTVGYAAAWALQQLDPDSNQAGRP
jgi:HEAT repeat protein